MFALPSFPPRSFPRREIVHFLTDNDSIGEAICKRAEALNAAAVVMAKHQRGAIAEFFLGSGAQRRRVGGAALEGKQLKSGHSMSV